MIINRPSVHIQPTLGRRLKAHLALSIEILFISGFHLVLDASPTVLRRTDRMHERTSRAYFTVGPNRAAVPVRSRSRAIDHEETTVPIEEYVR